MEIKYRIDLHKILPANPICAELGCAEGYFSREILNWGVDKLYMVDNWGHITDQRGDGNFEQEWHDKNYSSAMVRVMDYKNVTVLRGISWSMASFVEKETLDFLYIDCCHSYECVKKDLEAWAPKVKQGGIIAGHDFLNPAYGVQQAVNEFCGGRQQVIKENQVDDAGFWFIKE